jgi:hypothetical protein
MKTKYLYFAAFKIMIVVLISMNSSASGQGLEESDRRFGSYGGLSTSLGAINDQTAFLLGGRGGWILNINELQSFTVGGGGYWLINDIILPNGGTINFGYGGLELEYTVLYENLIYKSIRNLVGFGMLDYRAFIELCECNRSTFWVIEPALTMGININRLFRVNTAISYRIVPDVEHNLSGVTGNLTLKFGRFY